MKIVNNLTIEYPQSSYSKEAPVAPKGAREAGGRAAAPIPLYLVGGSGGALRSAKKPGDVCFFASLFHSIGQNAGIHLVLSYVASYLASGCPAHHTHAAACLAQEPNGLQIY